MIIVTIIAVVCILFGFYLLVEIARDRDTTDWKTEAYLDKFDEKLKRAPCPKRKKNERNK